MKICRQRLSGRRRGSPSTRASICTPKVDCSGGVLIELVEHLLGLGAALQLDDDAHAAPVGFIAQVRDVSRSFFAHQVGDTFDQGGFIHLVGISVMTMRYRLPAHLLDMGHAAQDDAALGRWRRRRRMPSVPTMIPPVGKSGPGMNFINSSIGTSSIVS